MRGALVMPSSLLTSRADGTNRSLSSRANSSASTRKPGRLIALIDKMYASPPAAKPCMRPAQAAGTSGTASTLRTGSVGNERVWLNGAASRKKGSSGQGFEPAKVEPEVVVIGKTRARRRAAMETLRRSPACARAEHRHAVETSVLAVRPLKLGQTAA